MSHHSDEPFDRKDFDRILRQFKDTASFRGAIGSYPAGKLTKQDEGAIQFALGEKDGKVVLDFGTLRVLERRSDPLTYPAST